MNTISHPNSLGHWGQDDWTDFTPAGGFPYTPGVIISAQPTASAAVATTSGHGEAFGTAASTATTTVALKVQAASPAFTIGVTREAYIAKPDALYNLGAMFTVTPTQTNAPATIEVIVQDKFSYSGKETYNYGTITSSDGYNVNNAYSWMSWSPILFTLKNGKYQTGDGMSLSDFTFTASSQENRVANVEVAAYAATGALMASREVTIVTHATTVDATPGVATAAEIGKVAQSFIGKTWNDTGCWNLACDISATAGASLPYNSQWITSDIGGNGQWTVSYSAYNGVKSNWMSALQTGDIVELGWAGLTFGHIFTIDRVANGTAYLVDNSGAAVPGGAPTDVTITERKITDYAPYIDQGTVVVFRDNGGTPSSGTGNLAPNTLVTPATTLAAGTTVAASSLFRSTDPDNNTITQYKIRDDDSSGYFSLAGKAAADGQWLTVNASQLSQLTYTAAATGLLSDVIEVQAYDGKVWGATDTGRVLTTGTAAAPKAFNLGTIATGVQVLTTASGSVTSGGTQSWNFTITGQATAVDIRFADMESQVAVEVFNSTDISQMGGPSAPD